MERLKHNLQLIFGQHLEIIDNQSRLQVKDHIQEPTRARRLTEPIYQISDWQDNNKGQAKGQVKLIV
jgi:dsRNA-specific ribonuclease